MRQENLYIHYDSVTNYIMTRGINFLSEDFPENHFPNNLILAESPNHVGQFDVQTNFKILRGSEEITDYMRACQRRNIRISNWIDFKSVELMHQLTPAEIAELLYLFHAHKTLRSAFFYKLQNDFVYLTMPNGLNKVYYRQMSHFYPRLQRVLQGHMTAIINERGNRRWFRRQMISNTVPKRLLKQLSSMFVTGLKINFSQAYLKNGYWRVPLMSIEDELTLLDKHQNLDLSIGEISYGLKSQQWALELFHETDR